MTLKPGQTVGPFILAEIVGTGGMGEVWRAQHKRTGTSVAIKVITSERAAEPRYRVNFLREVQAVAGLNHPGVVAIYDFGELRSPRGTSLPWYAMELASTSLAEVSIGDWGTLQRVLVEMLDALAHAHARGIIHRDLKPENVLLDANYAVKLTDFGMAHIVEFTKDTGNIFGPGGGTPDFMSPEQFRGEWRKFGPWTDLYALGGVAWELATGAPPYPGETVVQIAMAHMNQLPPALDALFDVPERFELWLRRLLQKRPLERYRRAADAQWALVHDVGADYPDAASRPRSRPGVPADVDRRETDELRAAPLGSRDTRDDAMRTLQVTYDLTPPFPSTWRTDQRASRIGGVGLGLFGIREIPFVGREGAREYLWDRLRAVDETRQNEVIFVYGDPGIGRTRFGQWISRRADELGAATIVKATHGPIPSRNDGLSGALTRFLGIEGVNAKRAADIVADRLGPSFDPTLIFDLLYRRKADDSLGTSTFAAPSERYAAVERLFQQLSWERPVIFFADDVQWGADTLLFVEHLMRRRTRTLIVATVRNDTLHNRYWESQLLSETELDPNASTIHLQPLTAAERADLAREMLDLDAALARIVAERSQGIPLFATQLVGDWVQRDFLEDGPTGFRLRDGAVIELPDDIYGLWTQRIAELETSMGTTDVGVVLEAAALLGRGEVKELGAVCARLGVAVPEGLVGELVRRRLATAEHSGFSFQHGMLREALERRAAEAGRTTAIYDAAARAADPGDPYRLAEFQIRAGRLDDAIANLLEALHLGVLTMSLDQSQQLIAMIDDLLDQVQASPGDPRRGRLFATSVGVERLTGDIPRARARAAELAELAARHRWRREEGYAHLQLGILAELAAEPADVVLAHFDEALAIFDAENDAAGRAHGYRALARFHLGVGNPENASTLTRKALAIMREQNDLDGIVECLLGLGSARLIAQDLAQAREHFEEVRALGDRHQMRLVLAEAHEGLGQVAEAEQDFPAAEQEYRQARELWAAVGSQTAHVASVHLAMLLLRQQQYTTARETLLATRSVVLGGALPRVAQVVDAGLMACAAVDADVELFDELNRELRGLLRRTPAPDLRVPETAFLAGNLWAGAGDRGRARKAFDIARNVFLALGAQRRADDVAIAIGKL